MVLASGLPGTEWLLSTLFDASLLTFEPPSGGSFFGRRDFLPFWGKIVNQCR